MCWGLLHVVLQQYVKTFKYQFNQPQTSCSLQSWVGAAPKDYNLCPQITPIESIEWQNVHTECLVMVTVDWFWSPRPRCQLNNLHIQTACLDEIWRIWNAHINASTKSNKVEGLDPWICKFDPFTCKLHKDYIRKSQKQWPLVSSNGESTCFSEFGLALQLPTTIHKLLVANLTFHRHKAHVSVQKTSAGQINQESGIQPFIFDEFICGGGVPFVSAFYQHSSVSCVVPVAPMLKRFDLDLAWTIVVQ